MPTTAVNARFCCFCLPLNYLRSIDFGLCSVQSWWHALQLHLDFHIVVFFPTNFNRKIMRTFLLSYKVHFVLTHTYIHNTYMYLLIVIKGRRRTALLRNDTDCNRFICKFGSLPFNKKANCIFGLNNSWIIFASYRMAEQGGPLLNAHKSWLLSAVKCASICAVVKEVW